MFKRLICLAILIALWLSVGPVATQAQDTEPPLFEVVEDCFVALPLGLGLNDRTECGYVTVPENRDDPDNDRTIRLAVVVLHPLSDDPLPDPVMFLDGGPGGAMMNWLIQDGYRFFAQPVLKTRRSIIFFAQRGVYPAEPAIEPAPQCDFVYAAQRDFYNDTTAATRDAHFAAWSECFDELARITDLTAYHATAIAADANDIRRALGYEQVNLWGESYGTRVGLTILRDYPGSVRAAILDAPLPLDANLAPDMLTHTVAALERLFADCAADAECTEIAPDLRTTFFETAAALNADPIVINRELQGSGEMAPLVIDGRRFTRMMPFGETGYLPKLIMEASEGRYVEAIEALLGPRWYYIYNRPVFHIVLCNEEMAFVAAKDMYAATEALPDYAPFFYTDWYALDVCAPGYFRTPPPVDKEPVSSDVPVMLMAGEFDPVTPPAYAEQIAATLDNAFVYTVPYAGHGLISDGRCLEIIRRDFLNDPTTAPDTSCLDGLEQRFTWADALP